MSYFIDSHCHLNFKAFKNDWHEVAERAFCGGVKGIINVGSNYETSHRAIEIASQSFPLDKGELKGVLPRLYASIGLHPIHVNDEEFNTLKFEQLICHPESRREPFGSNEGSDLTPTSHQSLVTNHSPVVAIGETGIDLYHDSNTLVKQQEVFIKSIDLANKHYLPVIVHNRNAGAEVLNILLFNRPRYGGVMHFFSEDWDYAQKIFDLGLIISFTGAITLKNIDNKTIDVIKKAPLCKIMVETDAPYVVPEPMKSNGTKRNEPAFVAEVAKKIAEIKNIDIDKVASQTTKNTIELFSLSS